MGWAVGTVNGRHIGYGVPATCDYPGCGADIDRGLGYACGDGVMGEDNCGLFFCDTHLSHFREDDEGGGDNVCERCAADEPPFAPTPDTREWAEHVLTDESWATWRDENPARVKALSGLLSKAVES